MPTGRAREALGLLAGTLACVGIALVFPFCATMAHVWRGPSESDPSGLAAVPQLFAFGIPLTACVVLAIASLATPTDRPGAKAPALVALTLIGVQFVVFLPFASYTAASLP